MVQDELFMGKHMNRIRWSILVVLSFAVSGLILTLMFWDQYINFGVVIKFPLSLFQVVSLVALQVIITSSVGIMLACIALAEPLHTGRLGSCIRYLVLR